MKNNKVHISYKYLRYSEGDNSLELDIEPLKSGSSIIYIPKKEKWNELFGEWAIYRRKEILANIIKELEENYNMEMYNFQEY